MKKFTASAKQMKPDPIYGSLLISKFINGIMNKGKKTIAQKIVYDAMEIAAKRVKDNDKGPLEVFEAALNNIKPNVEVKSKRVGGATYQVPMRIESKRAQTLGVRWLLEAVRKKKGKPMAVKLAEELVSAYNKEGAAYTTRENTHKMAEANRAFAHFAR